MTTIEQALKETADRAMNLAAGVSNRCKAIKALVDSNLLTEDQFVAVIGQSPCTAERDLKWAHEDFEAQKSHYESVCRVLGVPAYATYSED